MKVLIFLFSILASSTYAMAQPFCTVGDGGVNFEEFNLADNSTQFIDTTRGIKIRVEARPTDATCADCYTIAVELRDLAGTRSMAFWGSTENPVTVSTEAQFVDPTIKRKIPVYFTCGSK